MLDSRLTLRREDPHSSLGLYAWSYGLYVMPAYLLMVNPTYLYSDRQLHTLRFNNASADRDRAQRNLGIPVDDE
jgi:hypothetical protein